MTGGDPKFKKLESTLFLGHSKNRRTADTQTDILTPVQALTSRVVTVETFVLSLPESTKQPTLQSRFTWSSGQILETWEREVNFNLCGDFEKYSLFFNCVVKKAESLQSTRKIDSILSLLIDDQLKYKFGEISFLTFPIVVFSRDLI